MYEQISITRETSVISIHHSVNTEEYSSARYVQYISRYRIIARGSFKSYDANNSVLLSSQNFERLYAYLVIVAKCSDPINVIKQLIVNHVPKVAQTGISLNISI